MSSPDDEFTRGEMKERILHVLKIYPRISNSMLQVGIGPRISPAVWRPALEELISDNLVAVDNAVVETPVGRMQTYRVIFLASEPL